MICWFYVSRYLAECFAYRTAYFRDSLLTVSTIVAYWSNFTTKQALHEFILLTIYFVVINVVIVTKSARNNLLTLVTDWKCVTIVVFTSMDNANCIIYIYKWFYLFMSTTFFARYELIATKYKVLTIRIIFQCGFL